MHHVVLLSSQQRITREDCNCSKSQCLTYMPQFRGSLAAILSSSLILQPVAARVYEHLQSFRQLHAQAFLPPFFWVPPFADPSFFRAPPFSGPLLFLGPSFSGPFLPAVFRVSLSLIDMLSLFWALLFCIPCSGSLFCPFPLRAPFSQLVGVYLYLSLTCSITIASRK